MPSSLDNPSANDQNLISTSEFFHEEFSKVKQTGHKPHNKSKKKHELGGENTSKEKASKTIAETE